MQKIKKYGLRLVRYLGLFFLTLVLICLIIIAYSRFIIERKDAHTVAPQNSQFVSIGNGEEVSYQEISEKALTTIVFVGGLSGWSGTWGRTMTQLHTSLQKAGLFYNLLAIDLPPFGYSTADLNTGFFRDSQASRINAFRKAKKLDSVIFIAHSYGAGPVTEAVMQNPEGVDKLVIIDGVLNIGESRGKQKTGILLSKPVVNAFVSLVSHSAFLIKQRLQSFVFQSAHIDTELTKLYMKAFVLKGNSSRLSSWLISYMTDPLTYMSTDKYAYQKLSIPVRIIWGKEDSLTPIRLGYELFELVNGVGRNNAKIEVLEGVGHMPMIEDYEKSDVAILKSIIY